MRLRLPCLGTEVEMLPNYSLHQADTLMCVTCYLAAELQVVLKELGHLRVQTRLLHGGGVEASVIIKQIVSERILRVPSKQEVLQ